MLIVVDIPRHHAKKLGQQAWARDYYVSKETRAMTEKRAPKPGTPTPISIVFCRYPFYSEQWFPLSDQTLAHVAEVCIPLNAWHPERSPLSLLQEYQLSYDEVSTLTFVIAHHTTDVGPLRETFAQEKVRNAVFYVLAPNQATEETSVHCGTSRLSVEFQSHPPDHGLWFINKGGSRYSISLSSTLAFAGGGSGSGGGFVDLDSDEMDDVSLSSE
jgi:hypothetical protein